MSELMIEVERRETRGKNANRHLRRQGLVPAVVYGGGRDPVAIQISRRRLLDLMRGGGEHGLFLLKLAGSDARRHAMIRDMQVDPVSQQVIHLDFQRVVLTEAIRVDVPVEVEGTPLGVKNEGGMLDFITREIEVECLPGDIPANVVLDVSSLHVGQHVEAGALELPEKVKLLSDPEQVIVSVAHSRLAVEAEPEEEEVLLEAEKEEPEVIGRGKEAEEEEEGEG